LGYISQDILFFHKQKIQNSPLTNFGIITVSEIIVIIPTCGRLQPESLIIVPEWETDCLKPSGTFFAGKVPKAIHSEFISPKDKLPNFSGLWQSTH